jgi:hypothetical protein
LGSICGKELFKKKRNPARPVTSGGGAGRKQGWHQQDGYSKDDGDDANRHRASILWRTGSACLPAGRHSEKQVK